MKLWEHLLGRSGFRASLRNWHLTGSKAGVWQGALQAEGTETAQAPRVQEAQQASNAQQGREHGVWGGGPSGARDTTEREAMLVRDGGKGWARKYFRIPYNSGLYGFLHLQTTRFSLSRWGEWAGNFLSLRKRNSYTNPQLHDPRRKQIRCQYLSKLSQKLNKCSFAKGVSKTCMESKCWIILGEDSNPSFLRGEKKRCC